MGIKGTVRRSTDGDFIHANVDIDLIIDEEPEVGSLDKPGENILRWQEYLKAISFSGNVSHSGTLLSGEAETSCVRARQLHQVRMMMMIMIVMIIMMIVMIRPGWLTIGPDLSNSNYDWSSHQGYFKEGVTTGCTER